MKLERNYSKDEILSMYLNIVDYGSNAFGIKAAAHTFFSKLPSELSVEESVTAPVSQGQRLGTLTVKSGDQILRAIPLVAAEGVQRKDFGDLFGMVLRRAAMAKV